MYFSAVFTTVVLTFSILALSNPTKTKRASLQWIGVNESGPEFGDGKYPGVLNTDYVWPTLSTINNYTAHGFNAFRINILMERIVPNQLTGALDAAYLASLQQTVTYITNLGAYALINPHNYGRYYGNVITDTAGFQTFWKTVATPFKSNAKVVFDTNNEFHDMSGALVAQLNQAAINGIRAAGATTQYITVEGNAWTGAWTWNTTQGTDGLTNAQTMGSLTDSSNKLIYQMHQYLDSDGSGTSATCVSSTIGSERLASATAWLRAQKKIGLLGEFAGGVNSVCEAAVKDMLTYMVKNNDVWMGALWWAAGPWWANYIYSIEPGTGVAYAPYVPILAAY